MRDSDIADKPFAYQAGYIAFAERRPLKDNPFGRGGYDYTQWRTGYQDAKARGASRLTSEQMAEIMAESEWPE